MKTILTVVLSCFINSHELRRSECLKIYRLTEQRVEGFLPIDLKLKRVFYKRKHYDFDKFTYYQTLSEIDNIFNKETGERYDLRLGIISKALPAYLTFGGFYGNRVCVRGTAAISANRTQFKAYQDSFSVVLAHEVYHLLGGIHSSGQNYGNNLFEQILTCLNRG